MLLVIAIILAILVVPDAWDVPVIAIGALLELTETSVSVWLSGRGRAKVGPEALIGQTAEVVIACRPVGRVRVGGEGWQARCVAGAEVGQLVRIEAREGLTLVVEPLGDAEYPDRGATGR